MGSRLSFVLAGQNWWRRFHLLGQRSVAQPPLPDQSPLVSRVSQQLIWWALRDQESGSRYLTRHYWKALKRSDQATLHRATRFQAGTLLTQIFCQCLCSVAGLLRVDFFARLGCINFCRYWVSPCLRGHNRPLPRHLSLKSHHMTNDWCQSTKPLNCLQLAQTLWLYLFLPRLRPLPRLLQF